MSETRQHGDAGDANTVDVNTADASAATVSDGFAASDLQRKDDEHRHASDATSAFDVSLADQLQYTLTIKQAAELFARHDRKVPSERSIQRYCSDTPVSIRGLKIKTTYGQEWLINEPSLLAYIATLPIEPAASATPPVRGADSVASSADGDAGVATPANQSTKSTDDSVATGETRKLTDVLIENARLLERVEGRDDLVKFLRGELDKRDLHTQAILETFKVIGSRQVPRPEDERPVQASFIEPTS